MLRFANQLADTYCHLTATDAQTVSYKPPVLILAPYAS